MAVQDRITIDPDAHIFSIVRAIAAANEAVARASARTDEVAAREEGRVVEQVDRDALDSANHSYAAAIEALSGCIPCTLAGVRAALAALAKVDPPDAWWLPEAFQRLADSPALAGMSL